MKEMVPPRLLKWLICVFLAAVTFAAYSPVRENDFINLDDPEYVTQNPHVRQGVTPDVVHWAFTAYYSCNWHPLTWLSHALDCQSYGLNPAGHHLTSLAFHVANTILLFLLLQNLTSRPWPGAFVALLFALHPMHVESVAWVSERKDVLSAFFFLLTLLAYARYVELDKALDRRCWPVYGLTLLLFAFGLMSKPMLVTLPFVLLLLDYWPLARFELPLKGRRLFTTSRRLVCEKIPFLILAVLSCWVTFAAQKAGESVQSIASLPLNARLEDAAVAYGWYLHKLFWPVDLSVYYPLQNPPVSMPADTNLNAVLLLLGLLTAVAVWLVRRQPCMLVGWLWFLGMLVPVIGIVQVGNQAYADRYTYLPFIGLFIILAYGVPALLARVPRHRIFFPLIASLMLMMCFKLTAARLPLWKNTRTLMEQAIALDARNEAALNLLGVEYMNLGDSDKAVGYLKRATAACPGDYYAWNNLGGILSIQGRYEEAEAAFKMALVYSHDKAKPYDNLGNLFMTARRFPEAITNFKNALAINPNQPAVQGWLGQCYASNHQPAEAVVAFQAAIRADPGNGAAQLGLAIVLADTGRKAEAIVYYRNAVALETNTIVALNNLAWLLASASDPKCRDGQEAMRLAHHACTLTGFQEAFLIGTLAAAYAEAGRFDDAIATAQKARDVAIAHGQTSIAENNDRLLKLYQSGRAYHEDVSRDQ